MRLGFLGRLHLPQVPVNKILLRVSLTLNKFSDALNIYYSTSQTPPAASIASFAEDENL